MGQRRAVRRRQRHVAGGLRQHLLLPEGDFKDFKGPEPFIPRVRGHHEEWIEACKTGKPTGSNFDYAAALTIANHLGNVAYRIAQKLEWDPVSLRAKKTVRKRIGSSANRIAKGGRCESGFVLAYRAIPVFRPGGAEFRQRPGFQVLLGEREDDAFLFVEVFA